MIDLDGIRERADLFAIAGVDVKLKPVSATHPDTEKYGPCPFCCAGEDRFRVIGSGRGGKQTFFCRKCQASGDVFSYVALREKITLHGPDKKQNFEALERVARMIDAGYTPVVSPEELEKRRASAELQAARIAADRQAQLDKFTAEELWEAYARKMDERQKRWWAAQGIPESWQGYWVLGWTPRAPLAGNPEAYTIPFFGDGWAAINMQYRLAHAEGANKYRWGGLGYSSFFMAHPALGLTDECYICEGAKKAMVLALTRSDETQVYAVPSRADYADIAKAVKGAGRQWIILDPDATEHARKLAQQIGPSARVVTLPKKIDDAILGGMTMWDLRQIQRAARPQ